VEQYEGSELRATDVLEHVFCPRFTYFEHVLSLPEHQEKRYKVQRGRKVHEDKARLSGAYLRQRLGCVRKEAGVHLGTAAGLVGIVDEVLFFEDGTAAPLDYKWAMSPKRPYRTHRLQLAFYARLIREVLGLRVTRGFLVYVRSANKLAEVPLGDREERALQRVLDEMRRVLEGWYPGPTPRPAQCPDCCYRFVCDHP
jgi:CRISPR-associated exonuclease Cas4